MFFTCDYPTCKRNLRTLRICYSCQFAFHIYSFLCGKEGNLRRSEHVNLYLLPFSLLCCYDIKTHLRKSKDFNSYQSITIYFLFLLSTQGFGWIFALWKLEIRWNKLAKFFPVLFDTIEYHPNSSIVEDLSSWATLLKKMFGCVLIVTLGILAF
jgi:hypothetical protein